MSDTNKNKKPFSLVLVGGGSGGHVSPLRALAKTAESLLGEGNVHTTFISERGGSFDELMNEPFVHAKKKIMAGKFRRYHGDSLLTHLLDIKTILFNVRDFFTFMLGCIQAVIYLMLNRPDVIFLKGGFVSVPVGWAARIVGIPYVTHDSDAVPGLANRLTAKKAVKNLVALDGTFPYEPNKIVVTGIPVNEEFFKTSDSVKASAKKKLSIPENFLSVLITGGGLGAKNMNSAVIHALDNIASSKENQSDKLDMVVTHITGKALYNHALDEYENTTLRPDKINIVDFTTDMLTYIQAADIVVSRAGATAITECAAARKACLFIPGAHLTGGQQLHNANLLESKSAAFVVLEQDEDGIAKALIDLATNREKRELFGRNIAQFAVKDSSVKIVSILLEISGKKQYIDKNNTVDESQEETDESVEHEAK